MNDNKNVIEIAMGTLSCEILGSRHAVRLEECLRQDIRRFEAAHVDTIFLWSPRETQGLQRAHHLAHGHGLMISGSDSFLHDGRELDDDVCALIVDAQEVFISASPRE